MLKKFLGFTLAEVLMASRESGIENEVLYSRTNEPKGLSRNKNKFCAFTLAEVLITLAIIGIVAALTIPTVVNNYQKNAWYTAFKKMQNTIETKLQLTLAENGSPASWTSGAANPSEVAQKFFYSYLKVSKVCKESDNPSCFDYNSSMLDNSNSFPMSLLMFQGAGDAVILQDGSCFAVDLVGTVHGDVMDINFNDGIEFVFDTNGKKGPNVMGRDIFMIDYNFDGNKFSADVSDEIIESCTLEDEGSGCAARLIKEGKMNY